MANVGSPHHQQNRIQLTPIGERQLRLLSRYSGVVVEITINRYAYPHPLYAVTIGPRTGALSLVQLREWLSGLQVSDTAVKRVENIAPNESITLEVSVDQQEQRDERKK
jgi:hypothetical protein